MLENNEGKCGACHSPNENKIMNKCEYLEKCLNYLRLDLLGNPRISTSLAFNHRNVVLVFIGST